MSLIIAKKNQNHIILLSDTKLTYEDKIKTSSPLNGCIKQIQLEDKAIIAFAGNPFVADSAFKKINLNNNIENIKELLLDSNINSGKNTDFILIDISNLQVFEIKNGSINEKENCWIGSFKGFEDFQRHYLSDTKQAPTSVFAEIIELPLLASEGSLINSFYSKCFDSFKKVIENEKIPEVGGFVIPSVISQGIVKSPSYMQMFRKPIENWELIHNSPIPFGDASLGSHGVNFIGQKSNCFAVHFSMANFGYVYDRFENGIIIPQIFFMDEIDFYDYIYLSRGIQEGIGTQNHPLNHLQKAEIYLQSNLFSNSIIFLTRGLKCIFNELKDPNDITKQYLTFFEYAQNVQIIQEYQQYIRTLLLKRVYCYYRIGDYYLAINDCEQLLLFDKENIEALQFLVRSLQNVGLSTKAFSIINNQIDSVKSDSLLGIRCEMYYFSKQFSEMKNDFEKISPSYQLFEYLRENFINKSNVF